MNTTRLSAIACAGLFGCLFSVLSANAAFVSVDVDPATLGIQNMTTVVLGNPVTVNIVVTDLPESLQGFEFDVDFNSSVLTATGVMSGGFLPVPFPVENDIAAPDVNFAETNLGVSTATGDGVLAVNMFDTISLGTSNLTLNDVRLTGVNGPGDIFEITPVTLNNGMINVAPVPVPSSVVLFASGLAWLLRQYRKREAIL